MKHTVASRKYYHTFLLRAQEYLAFPLDFIMNWFSLPFTMITYYFLYSIVYQYNPTFAGTDLISLIVYFFIAICFRRITMQSALTDIVHEDIQQGRFLTIISRPIHYIGYFFSMRTAKMVIMGMMALPLVVLVPILFIPGYTFSFLALIEAYILAIAGFVATFQIYYIVGLLSFWFEQVWGFRHTIGIFIWLFSGIIIPIHILPGILQGFAFVLPFQHQAAVPALLILGQKTTMDFFTSLLILIGWVIVLFLLQGWVWKKGLLKHDGKG